MISTHHRLKAYCSEPIENIENYQEAVDDNEHTWECHHRLEVQGQFRNSRELLERCGMYWHRPANELIFLTETEHRILHHSGNKYCCGRHYSDETKRKMSEWQKGRKKSEETKHKLSEKMRGKPAWNKGKPRSLETRRKISESRRRYWMSQRINTSSTVGLS